MLPATTVERLAAAILLVSTVVVVLPLVPVMPITMGL